MSGWFAKWLDRNMPTREDMERSRFLKPIAHRILRSELWRFTRRSVPRGVALGMLAAFLIPIGQIFVAAFLALPARANVPIAALTTFITNPFTYPFWVVIANRVGKFILQVDAMTYGAPLNEQMRSSFGEWLRWLGHEGGPTAFGFVVLAALFGSVGYLASSFGWRIWIARKRRAKLTPKPLD
ncbi:DUF2062 domain-containing protein [Sphingorhabdus sp. Alg239-R122]|uniref:DUF2062 domain-containing protein n=1 Tax=Sphingorhabdus sp. Alg239-R122 TaxID=2305989 RepID=UPI001F07208A|nr:DUF2062 domain-containing protein [Sphingorhabdus sp. Alg239-R122]